MITADHRLIQLLALIDRVWVEAERGTVRRGGPQAYSDKTLFKVYVGSVLKQMGAHRSVWRYLARVPLVAAACGLVRLPNRRTLDRRVATIAPQAEVQLQALGLTLSLEAGTDATVVASDGSAFATPGPVWHTPDKDRGIIPAGLRGVDTEADWIQSTYHGWVYGYKAHVSIPVTPTTVRVVLGATVTGRACESHGLQDRVQDLPPLVHTLLLDAAYDDGALLATGAGYGIEVLVPLPKPAIGNAARVLSRSLAPLRLAFILTPCPAPAKPMPLSSFSWLYTPGI